MLMVPFITQQNLKLAPILFIKLLYTQVIYSNIFFVLQRLQETLKLIMFSSSTIAQTVLAALFISEINAQTPAPRKKREQSKIESHKLYVRVNPDFRENLLPFCANSPDTNGIKAHIGWDPELVLLAAVHPNGTNLAVVIPNSSVLGDCLCYINLVFY